MAFVRVAKTGEIAPGQIQELQVERTTIAVANVGGKFHAISNTCLHRGGPLGQGYLEGSVVICPWHGWSFDVTNGKDTQGQMTGVACYPVEVRGDEVYVDTSAGGSSV
jgi:nitrite reductase (NADH) small subunit/3-phenylpropionate/trans-cinnamate dioxygenase ferredoxin subunit